MIASLRRRHRFMFLGLSAGLPVLLAAALLDRPAIPAANLPGELLARASGDQLAAGDAAFSNHRATIARFADSLELQMGSALRAPDVLAYFSTAGGDVEAGLPQDARLLGAVDPNRPNLYPLAADATGHLVLYSLGHQRVLDSAHLDAVPGAAPPLSPPELAVETESTPAEGEEATQTGETTEGGEA